MAELRLKIPDELEKEIKEMPEEDWSEFALRAIMLRVFELKLEKSRKLRHALFKALISESKLTEEDALELGRKANEEMLEELNEKAFKKQSIVKVFSTSDLISFLSQTKT